MEVKRSFYTTVRQPLSISRVEEVACNFCSSRRYRVLGEESGFSVRECRDCGLVYVNPQPAASEMPAFYESMYPDAREETVRARSVGVVENHLARLLARRKPQGGRLLEVGCGYGSLLRRLAGGPWELSAIEMNATAVAYARTQAPEAAIAQASVEDAEFPPGSLDAVIAIAVIEHIKDCRAAIERMLEWLAVDGLLVIQVPYVAPFFRMKRLAPWIPVSMEAPRHLYDFRPSVLRGLLGRLGCRDIRAEVSRPHSSPHPLFTGLIWGVKVPGILLHALTGGRYIYPFAGAFVMHALKGAE